MKSLIHRTLFCVNIYGSYKLLKTVRFFAYPVYIFAFLIQISSMTDRMTDLLTESLTDRVVTEYYATTLA